MKQSELEKLNYEIDGVVYTPDYKVEEYEPILNEENEVVDFELVGFQMIQSAEDYYLNKDKPIEQEPNKMEVLENQVKELTQENIKCQQTIADMEIELLLK